MRSFGAGRYSGAPVTAFAARDNAFNGRIHWIATIQGDDHSHHIPPETKLHALMTQQ